MERDHVALDHAYASKKPRDESAVYLCALCKQTFTCKKIFKKHSKLHDEQQSNPNTPSNTRADCERGPKGDLYLCTISKQTFASEKMLRKHCKDHEHSSVSLQKKEHCDQKAKNREKLQIYVCILCAKTFNSKFRYKKHSILHKAVYFKQRRSLKNSSLFEFEFCLRCEKSFPNAITMKYHRLKHHESVYKRKPYVCTKCLKPFVFKTSLKRHYTYLHQNFKRKVIYKRTMNKMVSYKCHLCEGTFPSQLELIAHMNLHNSDLRHVCDYCQRGFLILSDLTDHYFLRHDSKSKEKGYKCAKCAACVGTKLGLIWHNKILHNDRFKLTAMRLKYKCDLCSVQFSKKGDYEFHARIHNSDYKEECSLCWQRLKDKSSLAIHMQLKHFHGRNNTVFKCDLCNKSFKSRGRLAHHIKTQHEGVRAEKTEKCFKCGKVFLHRTSLDKHKLVKHGEETETGMGEKYYEESFQCTQCGKVFGNRTSLRRHEVNVHESIKPDKFFCGVCHRDFKRYSDLSNHVNHMHKVTDERKQTQCAYCMKTFESRDKKLLHEKSAHKAFGKRFTCEICFATFAKLDGRRQHFAKKHANYKQYLCEYCGVSFVYERSLHDHIVVHTNIGRFSCNVCDKQFFYQSALDNHIRNHTGENSVYCQHCGKAFTTKTGLRYHLYVKKCGRESVKN